MRNPAWGGWRGRLAKLAWVPAVGAIIAACTEQANTNPTGDDAAPNLFGQAPDGSFGFPHEVVTSEGIESAGLYLPIFLIAAAIFVLVEGLLLYMAIRYRRRSSGDDLPEQVHGNNLLEIVWTAIPMAIVFVMFIGSTLVLTNVESRSEEHGAVVNVTAFRFGWIFDYQDPTSLDPESGEYVSTGLTIAGGGREGAPQMTLPVGTPTLIRLRAEDVIHSWYVPAFFFKRDAIPGRLTEFEFTIEQPGTYGGQCAEFCGLSHGDMFFSVNALEQAEYEAWFAEQTAGMAGSEGGQPADGPGGPDDPAGGPDDQAGGPDDPAGGPDGQADTAAVELEIATTPDKSIAFSTNSLEAPAGARVSVTYTNDSSIPHNIAFYDSEDASGSQLAVSEILTGPGATATVSFTAPTEPGAYLFRCELHPLQMMGTLSVVTPSA